MTIAEKALGHKNPLGITFGSRKKTLI